MLTSSTGIRVRASAATRESMPSYRPQPKISHGSAAYAAARSCVNSAPDGLGSTSRAGTPPPSAAGAEGEVLAGLEVEVGLEVPPGLGAEVGLRAEADVEVLAGLEVEAGLEVLAGLGAGVGLGTEVAVELRAEVEVEVG